MIIDYKIYESNNDPQITETINSSLQYKSNIGWIYIDINDHQIAENIKLEINKETKWGWLPTYIVFEKYSFKRIRSFTNYCIINNIPVFLEKSLEKTYNIGSQSTSAIYAESKDGFLKNLILIIDNMLSISFFSIYFFMLIDLFWIFWILTIKKQIPWIKIIIWIIITAQLAISIIGGPTEPQRLFIEALPLVILLLFNYIDLIFYSFEKNKITSYYLYLHNKKQVH
jgi:hypothetical protein